MVGFGLGRAGAGWVGQGRNRAVRRGQVRSKMGQECSEVVCSGLSMVGDDCVQYW